ncbi:hypothetical protein OHB06_42695 [Streptomyces sp. NBC_01604]|uniref:DUF6777 domain-containing protein n=1 Tax=Streptomyces sp. NBC_01604 TaxID=2975894 RepID=UPI003870B5FD
MRIPTGTLVTACALSAALLVAGCGGDGDQDTKASGELFLQPVAAQGPDPFTDSTATSAATPSPVTRTPQPDDGSGPTAVRSVSGETPGLYGGAARIGGCDVDRQIDHLTRDPAKARAFARVEGISQASIPAYLRGLAPVALRADTRVTNHGFSGGRATSYQSVLQAGTAVLVDDRGVPRVRCACGNPLKPPVATQGSPGTSGHPWAGYRPAQVIMVAPTAQAMTDITIIDVVTNTWIERRIGHDVRHDRVVPAPDPVPPTPIPDNSASISPTDERTESSSPETSDCVTPTATVTPDATDDVPTDGPTDVPTDVLTDVATDEPMDPSHEPTVPSDEPTDPSTETSASEPTDCPTATAVTATPPTSDPESPLVPSDDTSVPGLGTTVPDGPTAEEPTVEAPGTLHDSPDEVGPEAVPDTPDLPDGGGLIPDDPAGTDSVLGSPTDVFGS